MCSKCDEITDRAGQAFVICFANVDGARINVHFDGDMPMSTVRRELAELVERMDTLMQRQAEGRAAGAKIAEEVKTVMAEGGDVPAKIAQGLADSLNADAPEGCVATAENGKVTIEIDGHKFSALDIRELTGDSLPEIMSQVMETITEDFAETLSDLAGAKKA